MRVFPQVATCIGTDPNCFDLGNSGRPETIAPFYLDNVPYDPLIGDDYNTGYTIYVNSSGRVVVRAVGELTPVISVEK